VIFASFARAIIAGSQAVYRSLYLSQLRVRQIVPVKRDELVVDDRGLILCGCLRGMQHLDLTAQLGLKFTFSESRRSM
jgi:hypothetical protein